MGILLLQKDTYEKVTNLLNITLVLGNIEYINFYKVKDTKTDHIRLESRERREESGYRNKWFQDEERLLHMKGFDLTRFGGYKLVRRPGIRHISTQE